MQQLCQPPQLEKSALVVDAAVIVEAEGIAMATIALRLTPSRLRNNSAVCGEDRFP